MWDTRDRDIRNAMKAAVEATNLFDKVTCAGLPEDTSFSGSVSKIVNIEPLNYVDDDMCSEFDGTAVLLRTATAKVTFEASKEDGDLRDEDCERLCHLAANACNGTSLAGMTFPSKSKFTTFRWLKPDYPYRRCEATFTYTYDVPINGFGVAE